MKKLLALLLACSTMAFAAVGCGDKEEKEKEETTSSADSTEEDTTEEDTTEDDAEEDTTEEDTAEEDTTGEDDEDAFVIDSENFGDDDVTTGGSTGTVSVPEGSIDPILVGEWYSDELGFSFIFGNDSVMAIGMDYTEIMYFNANKNLVMSGVECPADYDGEVLSVTVTDETGAEAMHVMEMERADGANPDSLDGEYILTGGMLYDELQAMFADGETGAETRMIIDGETLEIEYRMCEYAADGQTIQIFASNSVLFEDMGEDASVCDYEISGTTMIMTDTSGVEMELTKQ